VRLSPLENQEGSEYINANFITIPYCSVSKELYISTQAPLESTIFDFWRMIWEQKSHCIVSLTNLAEKSRVKADRYWPLDKGCTEIHGDIVVTFLNVLCYKHIVVRKLTISRFGVERVVLQIHYSDWPDFGVPTSSIEVRNLIKLTDIWKKLNLGSGLDGPIVVHCSAGVGRTGCFIAIHSSIKHLCSGSPPQIMEIVRVMRQQRHKMVQTMDQYEFIYTVLQDEIVSRQCSEALSDHCLEEFLRKLLTGEESESESDELSSSNDSGDEPLDEPMDDSETRSVRNIFAVPSSAVAVSG